MPTDYYYDWNDNADDSHSDNEKSEDEVLCYEDWSTIYNQELWDMWYSMEEYLKAKYIDDELFGNIDPDDFFYDFCFLDSPRIEDTLDFAQWINHYLSDISYLWRLIRNYKYVFGRKSSEDFYYFIYKKICEY